MLDIRIGTERRLLALLEDEREWYTINPENPEAVATGEKIQDMVPVFVNNSDSVLNSLKAHRSVIESHMSTELARKLETDTQLTKSIMSAMHQLKGMGFVFRPSTVN